MGFFFFLGGGGEGHVWSTLRLRLRLGIVLGVGYTDSFLYPNSSASTCLGLLFSLYFSPGLLKPSPHTSRSCRGVADEPGAAG